LDGRTGKSPHGLQVGVVSDALAPDRRMARVRPRLGLGASSLLPAASIVPKIVRAGDAIVNNLRR